jgi:heat shock protein HtpX
MATVYDEINSNKGKTVGLLVVFMLFVGVLSALIGYIFFDSIYASTIAIPMAIVYAAVSYYSAGKMAVAMNGAKPVDQRQEPRLYKIVENLAITNGMPMPKVYVMEDPALNAFATGRDPDHAIVAATRGLLDALEDNELEGVMAHEMGHVKNYDIRVSMMAFALVAVISIISDIAMRSLIWGDHDNRNNGPALLIGLVLGLLSPFIAAMIQFAISRQREYLADATGAITTRYPEGLAKALEKIAKQGSITKKQNASTAHFFFASPLSKKSFTKLFSTHPPIEDRIARLRDMEDGIMRNEK